MNKIASVLCVVFVFLSSSYAQTNENLFEVAKFYSNKKSAISYTFDDGLEEHFTLVYPKLEELGFKATFWINGNAVNEFERGLQKKTPRINWNNLKIMAKNGHEISNHGWSHKNLTEIPIDEAKKEIRRNDSIILANVGVKPITYCYAYNSLNDTIVQMASQGRVATRTKQIALSYKNTEINLKFMVDKAIEDNEWVVTMIHGITYGWDAFIDPNVFWHHLNYVKKKDDEIWVATFRDVASYIKEQKNTQLEILKKRNKWIIIPKNNLDKTLFCSRLTMVINPTITEQITVKQKGENISLYYNEGKALFDFTPEGKIVVRLR